MSSLAEFTPITVTAETLGVLSKQPNYAELLCLYMAYVEVASWQEQKNIKATRGFMAQRLRWRPDKVSRVKKSLIELGLVKDLVKKSEQGKVVGHYISVQYVVKNHLLSIGATGFEEQLVLGATSTNNLQVSTNNSNKKYVEVFDELKRLLDVQSPLYTLTDKRKAHLKQRLSEFSEEQLYQSAKNLGASDYHKGNNPNGKKYSYPHFLIRDRDKVEEWLLVETVEEPTITQEEMDAIRARQEASVIYA